MPIDGEAEVGDLDDGGRRIAGVKGEHEDVACRKVAMNHARAAERDHARANLLEHLELVRHRHLVLARLEELVERAVRRELREEQLIGAFGAETEVPHEARMPTELHERRRLLLARAAGFHAQHCNRLRTPAESAAVDRLEAAMREHTPVKGHGGTRNELEVRREPLLDRVPQSMVLGERVVGKLCPGLWARVVRCEPALDVGAIVAVAIGAGNGVAHDPTANRAQEGRGRRTVHAM